MEAIIMAEGLGTRLLPLTQKTPKPLIKVGDYPILEHQIILLKEYGITDIYISVCHLKEKIKQYFKDGKKWGVRIKYHDAPKPMGTAGAVKQFENNITSSNFILTYCDYLIGADLNKMIDFHIRTPLHNMATIMVKKYYLPLECDHMIIDETNKITGIINRPHVPGTTFQNRSNIGIYICRKSLFNYLENKPLSFEKDVFPAILNSDNCLSAYYTNEYIGEIGTHERLQKVRQEYLLNKHKEIEFDNLPEFVSV